MLDKLLNNHLVEESFRIVQMGDKLKLMLN